MKIINMFFKDIKYKNSIEYVEDSGVVKVNNVEVD